MAAQSIPYDRPFEKPRFYVQTLETSYRVIQRVQRILAQEAGNCIIEERERPIARFTKREDAEQFYEDCVLGKLTSTDLDFLYHHYPRVYVLYEDNRRRLVITYCRQIRQENEESPYNP